jgi:hypothetical protein
VIMTHSRMMTHVCGVGLTILDHKLVKIKLDEEGVVHERNNNIGCIASLKVWQEQSTQKVCSHRRRINMHIRTVDQCQLARPRGRPFNHNDKIRIVVHF